MKITYEINPKAVWQDGTAITAVSLALGLAGACAIIVFGTLLARMNWLNFLRFCGAHSIVIYLAFFLPMAASRAKVASRSALGSAPSV